MNENTGLNVNDQALAARITQAARTVHPDAAFRTALDRQLDQVQHIHPTRRTLPILGAAAAALILLAGAIFAVPSLRALAQEVIDLITQATSDQVDQTVAFSPSANAQTFASVELAEAALERDFVVPGDLPGGVIGSNEQEAKVSSITYFPAYRNLLIKYQRPDYYGWWLEYSQVSTEVYEQMQSEQPIMVGQSANIQTVAFLFRDERVEGQVVRGSWHVVDNGEAQQEEIEQLASGETLSLETIWDNEAPMMRLTWQAEGVTYILNTNIEAVMQIEDDDLIRIAESIE